MTRSWIEPMVPLRILAIGLAGIAPVALGRGGDPGEVDAFVRALRDSEPDPRARALEERASELAHLHGSTAAWLEVRALGLLPAAAGEAPEPLTAAQQDLLELAAPRLPREEVLGTIAGQMGSHPDPAWRGAALLLLRWHGSAAEVPLLVDLLRGAQGELPSAGPLVDGFQDTLAQIARRDARIHGQLDWFAVNAASLRPAFVRSLGLAGDPEALPRLVGMLEDREIARVALQEISRLASRARPNARVGLAEAVRPFVAWSDRATRRHAIRALVALRDEAVIPDLIGIAESKEPRDHAAAFAALREITGRNLPDHVGRWRRWHEDEQRWLEKDAPAALERLASENEAEVVAAIRALSDRGLERERLAEEIARALRTHASATVRGQACIGLARLGSRAGLDALVHGLSDPDPAVGTHALNALRSITGLSLPWDARAWIRALQS